MNFGVDEPPMNFKGIMTTEQLAEENARLAHA